MSFSIRCGGKIGGSLLLIKPINDEILNVQTKFVNKKEKATCFADGT
ncbi:hypothetical protein [Emticicia aquatica]|nr:hypothetical protein [Emticicia aquatica]